MRRDDSDSAQRVREFSADGRLTVAQVLDYYLRFLQSRLSYQTTARVIHYAFRHWDHTPIETLTRAEVGQWFMGLHNTPGAANKALGILKAAIRYAQRMGIYDGGNPADSIQRWPSHTRSRYLRPDELARVWQVLSGASWHVRTFVTLQLLTGCRPSELRHMRWVDVDCLTGLWRKPTSKTEQPHLVPIPHQGVDLLKSVRPGIGWVFPGLTGTRPIAASTVRKNWVRIRKLANLPDVWNYDLRRTCASHLAMSGTNLPTIQHVLNHSSLQPTAIYARMNVETVKKALQTQADGWLVG